MGGIPGKLSDYYRPFSHITRVVLGATAFRSDLHGPGDE